MPASTLAQHEIFFGGNLEHAVTLLDEVIQAYPDDWWVLTMRGAAKYQMGDINGARADIEQAITLDSPVNFPYVFAIPIALHDGRLNDALELIQTVQTRFPDPAFVSLIMEAAYGLDSEENIYANAFEAFGNFVLRQWNEVIRITTMGWQCPPPSQISICCKDLLTAICGIMPQQERIIHN